MSLNPSARTRRHQPPPKPQSGWSPWSSLPFECRLSARSLRETLDGGQAFRWHREPGETDTWIGQWTGHVARLRPYGEGELQWSAPAGHETSTAEALRRYLDADRDCAALTDALPWRSDPPLAEAIAAFPGLRILRQPLGETLLAFLCSATKQIPQIKTMLANLAAGLGAPAPEHRKRLPSWEVLARVPETELRACGLGFRARHIKNTATVLSGDPGWEKRIEALPYPEAKQDLLRLPGVGEKVADCVLLFGAGRMEAFPVDTWILKVMQQLYGLDGWSPSQIALFGRRHFGPSAGLAQQYLFAWIREQNRAAKTRVSAREQETQKSK